MLWAAFLRERHLVELANIFHDDTDKELIEKEVLFVKGINPKYAHVIWQLRNERLHEDDLTAYDVPRFALHRLHSCCQGDNDKHVGDDSAAELKAVCHRLDSSSLRAAGYCQIAISVEARGKEQTTASDDIVYNQGNGRVRGEPTKVTCIASNARDGNACCIWTRPSPSPAYPRSSEYRPISTTPPLNAKWPTRRRSKEPKTEPQYSRCNQRTSTGCPYAPDFLHRPKKRRTPC